MSFGIRRCARLGVLAIAIAVVVSGVPASASAKAMSRSAQRLDLRSRALSATNNELRYLHTSWFKAIYPAYETTAAPVYGPDGSLQSTVSVEILPSRLTSIRAEAMAAYATAIALNKGYYRTKTVTVSGSVAAHRTVAWINDLAVSYGRDHWGSGWQSALWTTYMGFGARMVWNNLPPVTRSLVASDVAAEADHLLTIDPPYYMDASGTVLTPGDSKSEEDGWNASLLLFAAREFSSNPHSLDWDRQGRWYALMALATPAQVGTDPRIKGSNLNSDGTVTNHSRINPDYMFSVSEMIAKVSLVSARAGKKVPGEVMNNLGLVWWSLNNRMFPVPQFRPPGGTIYRRGKNHTPTPNIYYPTSIDRSAVRRFNAAEFDIEVFGAKIDPKSYGWAKAHLDFTLKQQSRHKAGYIFSKGETAYAEDEQFAAASLAETTYRLSSMR
ncbi:MAG: hypothetical protein P4L93_10120 [Coriobacteriia bacterium]|nr:hypothetical protein [Coriobacteriia bacterium]